MSRYIDVDMLRTVTDNFRFLHTGNYDYDCGFGDCVSRIESLMRNYSTADVAEVKHGEWKLCYEDWRKQIAGDECSVCGSQHFGVSISHYPYCPNCGARMDGGDFDEMPNNKSQE